MNEAQSAIPQGAVPLEKILAMLGKSQVQLQVAEENIAQMQRQIQNLSKAAVNANAQLAKKMEELARIPKEVQAQYAPKPAPEGPESAGTAVEQDLTLEDLDPRKTQPLPQREHDPVADPTN